jgi:hypothetical protein
MPDARDFTDARISKAIYKPSFSDDEAVEMIRQEIAERYSGSHETAA